MKCFYKFPVAKRFVVVCINEYDPVDLCSLCSLKGVPLAYDEVSLLRQHGDIYDDNGYIHLDIQANFVVFQPQRGQKLLVRGKLC